MTEPASDAPDALSEEERRSLTGPDLQLTDSEQAVYGNVVQALDQAGVEFVLSGLYSIHAYTGISRPTEDLDLLVRPDDVVPAARALAKRGFETVLEEPHWLAKALQRDLVVDLVFGTANGLWLVDHAWARRARIGTFCGEAIRVASPEDLIFHRLFITERHRFDMADVAHLILAEGRKMDWDWLLERVGEHWRLLLAHVLFFDFAYPSRRGAVPRRIRERLARRAREADGGGSDRSGRTAGPGEACMGTLISRFSFAIDVNDWGFRDARAEAVEAARSLPIVEEIRASDVWDVRRDGGVHPPERARAS